MANGVATGVAAGAARITASSGGVTSDPVTIAVVALAKGSVAIDQASVFFTGTGQTRSLTALAADAQGAPVAGPLVWSSSAPDKVFVDASGRLTALAIGSAQITATAAGTASAPTLVVVAEPQAGALLVTDAQVVSVGAPFLAPGAAQAAPAQYDVTLQGVAAPLPGTVVLAAESAPIAGQGGVDTPRRRRPARRHARRCTAAAAASRLRHRLDDPAVGVPGRPRRSARSNRSARRGAKRVSPGCIRSPRNARSTR